MKKTSLKRKIVSILLAQYRKIKAGRAEEKAGFHSISQREAYRLEPVLTDDIKKHYCERKFYAQIGYFPNLDRPRTYSEKIAWLALYYKNPMIRQCVDKYECKDYIRRTLGEQYCVPALGVYDNVNDIPWDSLPENYVLKSTAGWGAKQVIPVRAGRKMNMERVKSRMASWLYPWNTYYYQDLCITDEVITPRILIEPFLGGEEGLADYKIFCFNGKADMILIVKNRGSKDYEKTFFNISDWSVLPIHRAKTKVAADTKRPEFLDEMVRLAEKLAADVPLLRVDFYWVDGQLYIGELTFSPGLFLKITPRSTDDLLGEHLNIDKYLNAERKPVK